MSWDNVATNMTKNCFLACGFNIEEKWQEMFGDEKSIWQGFPSICWDWWKPPNLGQNVWLWNHKGVTVFTNFKWIGDWRWRFRCRWRPRYCTLGYWWEQSSTYTTKDSRESVWRIANVQPVLLFCWKYWTFNWFIYANQNWSIFQKISK